jgi:hypothetical protein
MASFVAYHKKKQLHLRELEGELLALLQKGVTEETASRAVEEVRQAQVRALKEKIAKLAPSEKNALAIEKLQNKINELQAAAATAVLEEYRRRTAHIKGPVSVPRAPRRGD